MKRSTILGVALVSVVGTAFGLAGAVVIAKAQEPVPLPRYAAYPSPPRIAEEPGSSPIAEPLLPESLDSNEFIDKGQSLASEAINALTAERDSIQERLEQINQELARWNAIQTGLLSAKDATPTEKPEHMLGIVNPPDDDALDLPPRVPEPTD